MCIKFNIIIVRLFCEDSTHRSNDIRDMTDCSATSSSEVQHPRTRRHVYGIHSSHYRSSKLRSERVPDPVFHLLTVGLQKNFLSQSVGKIEGIQFSHMGFLFSSGCVVIVFTNRSRLEGPRSSLSSLAPTWRQYIYTLLTRDFVHMGLKLIPLFLRNNF